MTITAEGMEVRLNTRLEMLTAKIDGRLPLSTNELGGAVYFLAGLVRIHRYVATQPRRIS